MATSLLDWIMDLMRDGGAREAFNSDPQAAMASAGFTNVCGADVRPFLFDEPSIREVAGVEAPQQDQGNDSPDIKYIINNYTIEAPGGPGGLGGGGNVIEGPTNDGPTVGDINGDGNTVTQAEVNTTTAEDNDAQSGAGNIVSGDGSAGADLITGSTVNDVQQGIIGDGNTSIITLTDNLNDLHVLSDLINLGDPMGATPLTENLSSEAANAGQDLQDLVSVLG